MAKANNTAIEELIKYFGYNKKTNPIVKQLLDKERQQIENAFNAGKSGNYTDASHYYFMEYIDND